MTPEVGDPITPLSPGWTVLDGEPTLWTWCEHHSEDKSTVEGASRFTPWTVLAEYSSYEYVVMLEGVIEITPDRAELVVVKAGDAFSVEPRHTGYGRSSNRRTSAF